MKPPLLAHPLPTYLPTYIRASQYVQEHIIIIIIVSQLFFPGIGKVKTERGRQVLHPFRLLAGEYVSRYDR